MDYSQRTVSCGSLGIMHADNIVTLNGWVHRLRDHGGIYFIDLRDRYGRTQIVIDKNSSPQAQKLAHSLHLEYCISITGKTCLRSPETINPNMPTGKIEVLVQKLEILSKSISLPFMIEDTNTIANEDTRLKHRYIDLRSGTMQHNIQLRHKVMQSARKYLNSQDFLEIETPTLIRSTPEGARDFLVPSRLKEGAFYALPQSPQIYKQILMMSGMDKYYQFARCYRDEDARGDRQPEHTQLDIELSFVKPEDIYQLVENLMKTIFKDCLDINISVPFARLTHHQSMETYGSDKPDLRISLPLQDFSEIASSLDFSVFKQALAHNSENSALQGSVKMLQVPNADVLSRKHIDNLEQVAKKHGASGLAWARFSTEHGFSGGISKFLSPKQDTIVKKFSLHNNDLLLFVADTWITTCTSLGMVRLEADKLLSLVSSQYQKQTPSKKDFSFVWITDFPLFEWNDNTNNWSPAHHMFTMPQEQYLSSLEQNPSKVKGLLYDLVCNGIELASGSIRIHTMELQQRIFDIIGMSKEEAQSRFGFLLEALQYGAPPHGGIAPGLDRLLMLMTGNTSIREVMPFPKNTMATSPMDESPNTVSSNQLEELHLQIIENNKET